MHHIVIRFRVEDGNTEQTISLWWDGLTTHRRPEETMPKAGHRFMLFQGTLAISIEGRPTENMASIFDPKRPVWTMGRLPRHKSGGALSYEQKKPPEEDTPPPFVWTCPTTHCLNLPLRANVRGRMFSLIAPRCQQPVSTGTTQKPLERCWA